MIIEAMYIIPVFLAVILLVATMIPIITMASTVNKAALASMMSLSQDGPYTEIIKYHNSTDSNINGVGDAIEMGIGNLLIDTGTTFVDTTRWYHNDETIVEDSIPLTDMSQYDQAIKSAVSDYADSIRPHLKDALWAALAISDRWFCFGDNIDHNNLTAERQIDSASRKMAGVLKKNIQSHDQLKTYLDTLKTVCDNIYPIGPPNYTIPETQYSNLFKLNWIKVMLIDSSLSDAMEKPNHTFYFGKYLTVYLDFGAGDNVAMAPLWQAQYQRLYLDLLGIYNANDPFYKREIHYPKYDDDAAREVAKTRFKAYLSGQGSPVAQHLDDEYKKFIKRFGITNTPKERLDDVTDSDCDFDFSETKMNHENGKLILDIKYHTVYGINFFNKFLPREFHFKGTTKIWSGLGGVKTQKTKRKWTVLDPNDTTPPSWAVPQFNILPTDYWPYAPDVGPYSPDPVSSDWPDNATRPFPCEYIASGRRAKEHSGWNYWKHNIQNWYAYIPKLNGTNGWWWGKKE